MSRLPTLPTLFGRATAVLGEHPTLLRTINRLRELCELDDDDVPPVPERCRSMDDFIARIKAHFAAEESEYFETLVDACPTLNAKVNALVRQHEHFLSTAHKLRVAFEQEPLSGETRAQLADFIDAFLEHEHQESTLLQEFLTREAVGQ